MDNNKSQEDIKELYEIINKDEDLKNVENILYEQKIMKIYQQKQWTIQEIGLWK